MSTSTHARAARGLFTGTSFVIAVVAMVGGLIAGASLAPAPAVVMTVDLSRVFNESNLNANNKLKLNALGAELTARVTDAEKKVKDKQGELELYGPNSTRWAQAQAELFTLIGELRAEQQFATGKMDTETSRSINELYLAIRDEIAKYAESNGIDYVMVNDTIPKLVPAEPTKMMDQIAQRRFLYARPTSDITVEVLAAINQGHPLSPGATAPATTASATPPAAAPKP